jgi:Domain of unknown function (DUF4263)
VVEFRRLKDLIRQNAKENEFDVATGDFSNLVVQGAEGFHFFYDSSEKRLIKSFLVREGPRVDTMCDVILAGNDDALTPRLRLWKKDKTKGGKDNVAEETATGDVAIVVKSMVDVGDCADNFWKLMEFLRTFKGVRLASHEFRVTPAVDAELLDALKGHNKDAVLTAVKTYLDGDITERDVQMLVDRRKTIEYFERLLSEESLIESERERLALKGIEGVWQRFFEDNPWIFGYGLTLVSCEAISEKGLELITTGANVFTGGGKRIDAAMRTRGFIQSLLFAEIKKHDTNLLMSRQYREPDVYQVSKELSGAVAQVQKTTHKAINDLQDLHRQSTPEGDFEFEVSTVSPRQVVIVGHLRELAPDGEINVEKMTSFELFRRSQLGVEILTFDEVLERARFIVESGEAITSATS